MNLLDKTIAVISPNAALKRVHARKKLEILNSGYGDHGASSYKKSLAGWTTRSRSPSDDIIGASSQILKTLRQRTRDLHMGAPLATSAHKTARTNVVGSGLTLKSQIDYNYLDMPVEDANEWQKNVEREFNIWAKDECDITRMMNFNDLQRLAYLAAMMSGDVFVPLPYKKFAGHIYGTKIMLIEADRIETPTNMQADPLVRGGVRVNAQGTVEAYYICRAHPLDSRAGNDAAKFDEYKAFGSKTGRRNILHLLQMERPGQMRGVPMLAPIIETLKQLTRYTYAELDAAVVSSMYTVFVTQQDPESNMGEGIPEDEKVSNSDNDYELGSGAVAYMAPGENIQIANPTRPNTAFEGFTVALCRQIGAAIEIPYEILIKSFMASYSASRAALLEAWKFFKQQRLWMANSFCQPAYEEWLFEAVAIGRIEAPGFFEDKAIRAAYCSAVWYGPSPGQIDPEKEVDAAIKRIDNNLSTREREAMELTGADFEDIITQREQEEKMIKERGLTNGKQITPAAKPKENTDELEPEDADGSVLEDKDGSE